MKETMSQSDKCQNSQAQTTIEEIAAHYSEILRLIGEDSSREGLIKTPMRAAKALYYATSGYRAEESEIINDAIFTHDGSNLIVVKDVEFYSFCEHHILPFFGTMSIGYIPDGKIVGLSKVARIVDMYARRLQVQERLSQQVCDTLMRVTGAKGVIAKCTAQHLCMKMRGVEKQESSTTSLAYNGVFADDLVLRTEFLAAINH